ncbi:MAG: cell division protein ZapD [Legionellales bacterium]|nr:cell division protein ZapD [Legionellales bacterium]|tara:strand:- start:45852 stop:46613 length:762 start_codon:yes stop_codon:yes gene_type:complete
MIIYEHPLNELMRTCLRLEQLFQQAIPYIDSSHSTDSHIAMTLLGDIMSLVERPHLKSNFTKELLRLNTYLSRLTDCEGVDHTRLSDVIADLDTQQQRLHSADGKFGQRLKENFHLKTVRQHAHTAGGTSCFDTPAYHHWLNSDADRRRDDLRRWYAECNDVLQTVDLILDLVRQCGGMRDEVAQHGSFDQALDATKPCQLVRIAMDKHSDLYPEVSIGKHHLTIRYYRFNDTDDKPHQTEEDVSFKLACCIL